MASLFQACKSAVRNKEGGTFNVGGYDIDIEMYSQQDIQDDLTYGDLVIGDDDESKIVLFADNTITIPEGYILTPKKPKKSLVIFCNTLINNGTISMYQKAPNVLPHDYYIIEGSIIGSNRNVIIPAYAKNQVPALEFSGGDSPVFTLNGNNGTNRNCGSGGQGCSEYVSGSRIQNANRLGASGSGYAFGGGAGSGGAFWYYGGTNYPARVADVSPTYPMRASSGSTYHTWQYNEGGVGNPIGKTYKGSNQDVTSTYGNNFGCGGRIIIFCSSFTNNGIINVNGTATKNILPSASSWGAGGASGAGAVDLFYTTLEAQGNITANGGATFTYTGRGGNVSPGKGGDGSITLTQWNLDKVIKEERKMFTKDNWVYLFNNYSQRLREDVI